MMNWVLVLIFSACGGEKDTGDEPSSVDSPTFYQDVLPIIGENCQQCHNSSQPMGGAFPLETYEQVSAFAKILARKMRPEGDTQDPFFMPPFNARSEAECAPPHPFRGVYEVSDEQYETFLDWIRACKPEGDPEESAPFTVPPISGLSGETQQLTFAGEYAVPPPGPEGADSFRCFAMQFEDGNVSMDEEVWINGVEFTPGNPAVAHHMSMFSVPGLAEHMAAGLVEDPETNSWDCQGIAAVGRADGQYHVRDYRFLWGWVPGIRPLELGDGMAIRHPAGTGIVVQMHYNTQANPTDLTDLSSLAVLAGAVAPQREARIELFGLSGAEGTDLVNEPPFEVPHGATNHVESYTEVFEGDDVRLWGFVPHMHLAGTSIRMRTDNGDGEETCLVNVPRYDYNWQQMYQYDAPVDTLPVLSEGSRLTVECTYNNSESNIMLEKYLGGPVEEGVVLGRETHQEMCIVAVGVSCDGVCQ